MTQGAQNLQLTFSFKFLTSMSPWWLLLGLVSRYLIFKLNADKPLKPGDVHICQGTWSPLVVALWATSHYLNQWCLIVNYTPRDTFQRNLNHNMKVSLWEIESQKVVCKMLAILWRSKCDKSVSWLMHNGWMMTTHFNIKLCCLPSYQQNKDHCGESECPMIIKIISLQRSDSYQIILSPKLNILNC